MTCPLLSQSQSSSFSVHHEFFLIVELHSQGSFKRKHFPHCGVYRNSKLSLSEIWGFSSNQEGDIRQEVWNSCEVIVTVRQRNRVKQLSLSQEQIRSNIYHLQFVIYKDKLLLFLSQGTVVTFATFPRRLSFHLERQCYDKGAP